MWYLLLYLTLQYWFVSLSVYLSLSVCLCLCLSVSVSVCLFLNLPIIYLYIEHRYCIKSGSGTWASSVGKKPYQTKEWDILVRRNTYLQMLLIQICFSLSDRKVCNRQWVYIYIYIISQFSSEIWHNLAPTRFHGYGRGLSPRGDFLHCLSCFTRVKLW